VHTAVRSATPFGDFSSSVQIDTALAPVFHSQGLQQQNSQ
jgi:hypothetical protein